MLVIRTSSIILHPFFFKFEVMSFKETAFQESSSLTLTHLSRPHFAVLLLLRFEQKTGKSEGGTEVEKSSPSISVETFGREQ